jgi:hypothetical protein
MRLSSNGHPPLLLLRVAVEIARSSLQPKDEPTSLKPMVVLFPIDLKLG